MRTVEYFRCWMDNTWDTDDIEVPADTPDHLLDAVVQRAAEMINWSSEPPAFVGVYHVPDSEDDYGLDDPDN